VTQPVSTAAPTPAGPTRLLAQFIAGLDHDAIPEPVRERAKVILLDTLASALAGRAGDEVKQVRALAAALGTSQEATLITGGGASLAGAALINGYLVTAVTVCDVHRPTLYHTTPQVIPPALAIGERVNASGRALLTAIVAGLETSVRVALGTNYPEFRKRGWHSPGVVGPFGGAAAGGVLLGLDAERQCNAFALAGSQSAGTFAHWGTPTIKFHQCRGSLSGTMAALLAEQGFRASPEILAHPDGGLYRAYSDGGKPEHVTQALGRDWRLHEIALRRWPAASSVQAMITALFALIERHALRAGQIERIDVGLSQVVYDMHGTLPWNDKFKALLSAPYITAIILHDRRCWLEQFLPERFSDPAVDAFARERVRVSAQPQLAGNAASVSVVLRDGRVLSDTRTEARGDPGDPLSWDDVVGKLEQAVEGWREPAWTRQLVDTVAGLEHLPDLRGLFALLRG
jgi:2-methylcitrate dehydratase PrpD